MHISICKFSLKGLEPEVVIDSRAATPKECLTEDLYYYVNFSPFFLYRNDYVIIGQFLGRTGNQIRLKKCKKLKGNTPPKNSHFGIGHLENPTYCRQMIGLPSALEKDRWVVLAVNSKLTKILEQPFIVKSWKSMKKLANALESLKHYPEISTILHKEKSRAWTPLEGQEIFAASRSKIEITLKITLLTNVEKIKELKPMFQLTKVGETLYRILEKHFGR